MRVGRLLRRVGPLMFAPPTSADITPGEIAAWVTVSLASVDGTPKDVDLSVLAELCDQVQDSLEDYTGRVLSPSYVRFMMDLEDVMIFESAAPMGRSVQPGDSAWHPSWSANAPWTSQQVRVDRREIQLVGASGQAWPVIKIMSLTTYSSAGVATVMSPASYMCVPSHNGGRIVLVDSVSWPADLRQFSCVQADILCGYGPTKVTVTLASVTVGQTLDINGLTFTAAAATSVAAREFQVGGTDAAAATELAVCLADATYGVAGIEIARASAILTLRTYDAFAIAGETDATTITIATVDQNVPGLLRLTAKEALTYWYRNPGVGYVTNGLTGGVAGLPPHIGTLLKRLDMSGFCKPPGIY